MVDHAGECHSRCAAAGADFAAWPIAAQSPTDWPAVAGDVGAMKYSPIDQITPANVTS